jgi:hypothetical protein
MGHCNHGERRRCLMVPPCLSDGPCVSESELSCSVPGSLPGWRGSSAEDHLVQALRSVRSFLDRLPPLLGDLYPRDRPPPAADVGDGPLHLGKPVERQHG